MQANGGAGAMPHCFNSAIRGSYHSAKFFACQQTLKPPCFDKGLHILLFICLSAF